MKKFISIILILLIVLSFGSTFADGFKIDIVRGEINEYSHLYPFGEATEFNGKYFYSSFNYITNSTVTDSYMCKVGYCLPIGHYKVTNNTSYPGCIYIYNVNSFWEGSYDNVNHRTYSYETYDSNADSIQIKSNESAEIEIKENSWVYLGSHSFPVTRTNEYYTFEKID